MKRKLLRNVLILALSITLFYITAAGLDKEIKSNTERMNDYATTHAITALNSEVDESESLEAIARSECEGKGVSPEVVLAIIDVESGGNAKAVGDNGESIGLMQIQPRWHMERMTKLGVTDLYNPKQNITVGCDILAELLDRYGNYKTALSVYNSGNTEDGLAYAERIMKCIE